MYAPASLESAFRVAPELTFRATTCALAIGAPQLEFAAVAVRPAERNGRTRDLEHVPGLSIRDAARVGEHAAGHADAVFLPPPAAVRKMLGLPPRPVRG